MAIITISRGSYSRGRQVAERLGQRLGYKVISREVLISTSEEFNIPEIKLKKALHNAPSVLDRFSYGKERYLAFIRANILEQLAQDNTIYHGLAGHAFIQGVSHELDVRIRADFEDRIKRYREGVKQEEGKEVSEEAARYRLQKDDEERHKWSVHITGVDPCNPANYDLIYNASKFKVNDIVESIAQFSELPYLQTTAESQKKIEQLMLAALVKASIVYELPKAEVSCQDDVCYVNVNADVGLENHIQQIVKEKATSVKGIQDLKVYVAPFSGALS